MTKIFTAQEMREAADNFWVGGVISEVKDEAGRVVKHIKHDAVIAMLHQAADMMEQEERREKRYEYALYSRPLVSSSGDPVGEIFSSKEPVRRIMFPGDSIVRREVGEWEEVKE